MMMTISACLWLGAFPLLQFGTYSHITADKWTIMLILTGFTVLCAVTDLILALVRDGRVAWRRLFTGRAVPLIIASVLSLLIILSCIFSRYGSAVFIGASSRREGLLSQLCYLGLFFMFAFSRVRRTPVVFSAAAGVIAFCAVVVLQRHGVNVFGLYPYGRSYATTPEFQGTIGNIDMDTGYLVLVSGLLLTEFIKACAPGGFRKLLRVFLLAVLPLALACAVCLVITMGVQFGVIALSALAVFTGLRLIPRKLRLLRIPIVILLLVAVLVVVWVWPGQGGGIWELHEIMHGRLQLSFGSNRIAVWLFSLRLAFQSPASALLGGGSDTFEPRFNQYISENGLVVPKYQGNVPLPDYFDNPHNEYIAHLVNHGLPAALLFAALIILLLVRRRRDPAALQAPNYIHALSPWKAAVLCYAVQAIFSFSVPLVAPMFWVVLGLAAGDEKS